MSVEIPPQNSCKPFQEKHIGSEVSEILRYTQIDILLLEYKNIVNKTNYTWCEKCDKLEFSDKGFISSWTVDGLPLYPAESSIRGGDTLPWREELRLPERLRYWLCGERDLDRSVSSLCLPMLNNLKVQQKIFQIFRCLASL